jgi:hypothetical protein
MRAKARDILILRLQITDFSTTGSAVLKRVIMGENRLIRHFRFKL